MLDDPFVKYRERILLKSIIIQYKRRSLSKEDFQTELKCSDREK